MLTTAPRSGKNKIALTGHVTTMSRACFILFQAGLCVSFHDQSIIFQITEAALMWPRQILLPVLIEATHLFAWQTALWSAIFAQIPGQILLFARVIWDWLASKSELEDWWQSRRLRSLFYFSSDRAGVHFVYSVCSITTTSRLFSDLTHLIQSSIFQPHRGCTWQLRMLLPSYIPFSAMQQSSSVMCPLNINSLTRYFRP